MFDWKGLYRKQRKQTSGTYALKSIQAKVENATAWKTKSKYETFL